jgi:hypothetical protein
MYSSCEVGADRIRSTRLAISTWLASECSNKGRSSLEGTALGRVDYTCNDRIHSGRYSPHFSSMLASSEQAFLFSSFMAACTGNIAS